MKQLSTQEWVFRGERVCPSSLTWEEVLDLWAAAEVKKETIEKRISVVEEQLQNAKRKLETLQQIENDLLRAKPKSPFRNMEFVTLKMVYNDAPIIIPKRDAAYLIGTGDYYLSEENLVAA